MTATGIVLAGAAWLALQIPLGMLVGYCIRRSQIVAIPVAVRDTKTRRPFVGQSHVLLRG